MTILERKKLLREKLFLTAIVDERKHLELADEHAEEGLANLLDRLVGQTFERRQNRLVNFTWCATECLELSFVLANIFFDDGELVLDVRARLVVGRVVVFVAVVGVARVDLNGGEGHVFRG